MSDQPTRTLPPDGTANETHALDVTARVAPSPASPADRYELHTPIARGGMGEVFAARDLALNREVAVKVLRDDLRGRPAIAARFLEEAHITAQLQHPNIPPVHDLGTLPDGRPFLAMKLVKGRTLAGLLAHSRPDGVTLLAVFEQVCQAVAFAHERSVIHRDLKPGNVMVGKFNEVQVMDWGLAKVLGEPAPAAEQPANADREAPVSVIQTDRDGSSLTQAGSLLGTPAYMPPEQAKGEVERTDRRSDVFSLGAVLCELLTGKPPYVAPTSTEVQALALTAQLGPALERLGACGADPELVALAKRCLSPDPDLRPADAGEVARAVADHRTGVAERLRAAELARARAEERRKRARVQLTLLGVIGLLLAAGGAVAWYLDREETERAAARERERVRHREIVTAALDEAEKALRADDLPAATAALGRANERLGDDRAADLDERYRSLLRDRDMVETLEFLADEQRTRQDHVSLGFDDEGGYVEAFRRFGFDPSAGDPADMADRVNRSPIRARLVAGLYTAFGRGAMLTTVMPPKLPALLDRLDDDPVRKSIRDAVTTFDPDRVRAAVLAADPARLTPPLALALRLQLPRADGRRLLVAVWERYPGDFPLNVEIAGWGEEGKEPTDGLRHTRLLTALRPTSPLGYFALGTKLKDAKRYDEALAAFRTVRALTPRNPVWVDGFIAAILEERDGPRAARDYLREMLGKDPANPLAHVLLGAALRSDGRTDEALGHYLRAAELDPTDYHSHMIAIRLLGEKGELNRAIALCESAYRTVPRGLFSYNFPDTRGQLLVRQGRYRAAVAAHEEALAAVAALRSDLRESEFFGPARVNAARAAVLAGTGDGIDQVPPGERRALRGKALGVLEVYVEGLRKVFRGPLVNPWAINLRVRELLSDEVFARVRNPFLLAALPPDEIANWLAFWAEVRAFRDELDRAAPPPREVKRP